ILKQLALAQNILKQTRGEVACAPELEPHLAQLDEYSAQIAALDDPAISLERLCEGLGQLSFTAASRKKVPAELQEDKKMIAERCKLVKELLKPLSESFGRRPMALMLADLREQQPLLQALVRLVSNFGKNYAAAKRRKSLVDFSDIEHMALQILQAGGGEEYRQRFAYVLVDEYQDINGVQESLIQAVSRGDNLFVVGDVKQSIYRFRLADPGLFMAKFNDYGQGQGGLRIDLQANFRSTASVIDCVNGLFALLMRGGAAELVYDNSAALQVTRQEQTPSAELLICDRGRQTEEGTALRSALEYEAMLVAGQIRELVTAGEYGYGDIAILLRSPKNRAAVFAAALRKLYIPVCGADDDNADSGDKRLLIAYLKIIDNPYQDIPLAAVLLSPLVGLTADELLALRRGGTVLYEQLKLAAVAEPNGKIARFLAVFNKRRASERRPSELLRALAEQDGYYHLAGALPDGGQRQKNIDELLALAEEYEESSYAGLYRFVCYLDELEAVKKSTKDQVKAGGGAVKILSVHNSKGLEFPVVFVSALGAKFNKRDLAADLLYHKDLGLAARIVRRGQKIKYPSLALEALKIKLAGEDLAEELRILYVALTRARDRLFLTASIDNLPTSQERWQAQPLSEQALLNDSRAIDWIGRALVCNPQLALVQKFFTPAELEVKFAAAPLPPPIQETESVYEAENAEVLAALNYQYPFAAVCDFAAKWSVSDAAKNYAAENPHRANDKAGQSLHRQVPLVPQLTEDEAAAPPALSPSDYGTAFHRLLELLLNDHEVLNTTGSCPVSQIAEKIAAWQQKGLLPANLPVEIIANKAAAFLAAPLGQRVCRAEQIECEYNFIYALDAERVGAQAIGQKVLLQGLADLLFYEGGRWVLVDYKTGGKSLTEAELRAKYQAQLALYREAIGAIWQTAIPEAYIYMLDDGRLIAV
ncbi:MAG: UvrD-helicase domain-containing protein, partial [Clostridia bacterium]|nr:UvrD-helicase domain-containing protein [Clostridia bacterium]